MNQRSTGGCVRIAAALLAAAVVPAVVQAQAYPAKPVRILVGFTPGAGVDIAIRLIAPKTAELLGQQVIVDNRPGASGNIAAELGARAPADGCASFTCRTAERRRRS